MVLDPDRPSLAELIEETLKSAALDRRGPFPAYVLDYTPGSSEDPATARVQPVFAEVQRHPAGDRVVDLPEIPKAIVLMPGSSEFAISFPLKKGDEGLVFIVDRSMETWRQSKGSKPVDPAFNWTHNLSDAFFVPTQVHAPVKSDPDKFTVGVADGTTRIAFTPDGEIEITSTKNVTVDAKGSATVTSSGDITSDAGGNAVIHGSGETRLGSATPLDYVALSQLVQLELVKVQTWLATHTHAVIGVPSGVPGVTLPPVAPPPAPGSVAAAKTKAK
jgi:hypothetical protein